MIRNETKNRVIVTKATPVRNIVSQGFGLMFRKKLRDEGWVFLLHYTSSWDVTNLFVFQTIDVLWLDKNQKLLQKRTVSPFRPRIPGIKKTRYLVELPAGSAQTCAVGDHITWKFEQAKA